MPRGGKGRTDAHGAPPAMAGASALDEPALGVAIELADEALRGLSLSRQRYASLVSMLYEGVYQRMPYAQLLDFARLSAWEMLRESGQPPVAEYRRAG